MERDAVPVASNADRPMQDARGYESGTKGKQNALEHGRYSAAALARRAAIAALGGFASRRRANGMMVYALPHCLLDHFQVRWIRTRRGLQMSVENRVSRKSPELSEDELATVGGGTRKSGEGQRDFDSKATFGDLVEGMTRTVVRTVVR